MKHWPQAEQIPFYTGGLLLVVMTWLLFIQNPTPNMMLRYAGWLVWAIGIALIFWPVFELRSKGGAEAGESYVHTKLLVKSGIYAVVRHPQYLGWLLMYPALMLFGQSWWMVALGAGGILCVGLFTRQEDRHLIEKFGDEYRHYMAEVPGLNIVLGLLRLLMKSKGRPAK